MAKYNIGWECRPYHPEIEGKGHDYKILQNMAELLFKISTRWTSIFLPFKYRFPELSRHAKKKRKLMPL
jgi:hypothetical protein